MQVSKICASLFSLIILSFSLNAQLFEPFLTSPQLNPAPMTSALAGGSGQIEFKLNQVDENIPLTAGDPILINVQMENMSPTGGVAAVSGMAATLFNWTYDATSNKLTGEQTATIDGNLFSGDIVVDITVDSDTDEATILNGFTAKLIPSASIASTNDILNDEIAAFSWAGSDISKSVTLLPTVINGINTGMFIQCRVIEQNNVPTEGPINIILPRDARLTFAYDPTLTSDPLGSVNNMDWTYDGSNSSFHIWTMSTPLAADGISTFSILDVSYDPQTTSGSVAYTFSILAGSGSENDFTNNIDVETLSYFSN